MKRKSRKIIAAVFAAFFSFYALSYAADKKEELKRYLAEINPTLTNVQITSRNLTQRLLPVEGAVKQMADYIDKIKSTAPPEFMLREHKMILLSFKKLRLGFYLLHHGEKSVSVRTVKRGAYLFREAVKKILEYSEEEGILKKR
jgi:hypothetical protein